MRYTLLLFIIFLTTQTWAAEIPISQFTKAIEQASPESKYQYYQYRARAYSRKNMPEQAMADLTASINLNPSIMAYRERADILIKMDRYQEALDDMTACINLNPTTTDYKKRTNILIKMDRYQEALDDINTILKTEPGNLDMYRLRSKAYFEVKQYDEALKDARLVLAKNPNDSASRLIMMESYTALTPEKDIVMGNKGSSSKRRKVKNRAGKIQIRPRLPVISFKNEKTRTKTAKTKTKAKTVKKKT